MKRLARPYYKSFPNIKYLYVEYNPYIENEMEAVDDHLYFRGEENFDKIFEKSVRAIEYVLANYDTPFIIRTNLSTFWNIPRLLDFLRGVPKSGIIGGVYNNFLGGFISGIGITMTADYAAALVPHAYDKLSHTSDDMYISEIFRARNSFGESL